MLEVILLALALAMDAFAVSIGLGANTTKLQDNKSKQMSRQLTVLAILAGIYFGVFQGVMPALGHLLGQAVLSQFAQYAPWIGGIILCGLGVKMGYEALFGDHEVVEDAIETEEIKENQEKPAKKVSHKLMLSLAIATSVDAMGAGFTLSLLSFSPWLACVLIAVITAILSGVGVFIGNYFGEKLEAYAEIFGSVVLIGIGLNMIL